MRNLQKKETLTLRKNKQGIEELSVIQFASIGIACHALCLIDHIGLLKKLLANEPFKEIDLSRLPNPPLVKTALITLIGAGVISLKKRTYSLTNLGKKLAKYIGILTVPLIGYRKLFSKQLEIFNSPASYKQSDIDYASIALCSIDFGLNDIDPLILDIFKTLKPQGTICDLGCGTGEKLVKICKKTNSPGLGIEKNKHVIEKCQQFAKKSRVKIIRRNVLNLKDTWEDVDIVLMSFVCHDIDSPKCSKVLKSFQVNFPNMRYLIIVDIVSLSNKVPTILPGFDYVHGLQGYVPRNYEETLEIFKKGDYKIFKEITVPNMPNTFIWLLEPNKSHEKHTKKSLSTRINGFKNREPD